MRDHATNGAVEDLGGSSVMEGTVLGVNVVGLPLEVHVLELRAEERTRDVNVLTTDHSHLLALKELLRDGRRKTTKQMALGVNSHLLLKRHFVDLTCPCEWIVDSMVIW